MGARGKFPGVWLRGKRLWVWWVDESGERHRKPTEYVLGEEHKAAAVRALIVQQVEKKKGSKGEKTTGPMTFARWREEWIAEQHRRKIPEAKNLEDRLWHTVGSTLDEMLLREIRKRHVADLVRHLKEHGRTRRPPGSKKPPEKLSPRMIHHIYGALRKMFGDAIEDEFILANPCQIRKEDRILPTKRDKDPTWRRAARYDAGEVVALTSDERLPAYRRMRNGLLLLGCMRSGEASARRFRDWRPEMSPLGGLDIFTAFDSHRGIEKEVKTDNPRTMPVHPRLAAMLTEWELFGWQARYGRPPTKDDLIVPTVDRFEGGPSKMMRAQNGLRQLHNDLKILRLRQRWQHDTRRTFISLAQEAGAPPHILKWITHGPPSGVMAGYTAFEWAALCKQVSCLNLEPKIGPPETPLVSEASVTAVSQSNLQPLFLNKLNNLEDN